MDNGRIEPAHARQCPRHLAGHFLQVALQGGIHFQGNKCSGHAANSKLSSSAPSMVSTWIRCSEIAINFSFFSRKILRAVAYACSTSVEISASIFAAVSALIDELPSASGLSKTLPSEVMPNSQTMRRAILVTDRKST